MVRTGLLSVGRAVRCYVGLHDRFEVRRRHAHDPAEAKHAPAFADEVESLRAAQMLDQVRAIGERHRPIGIRQTPTHIGVDDARRKALGLSSPIAPAR